MIKRILLALLSLIPVLANSQSDTLKSIKLDDIFVTSTRTKVESVPSTIIKMDSTKTYFAQETPSFFSKTPSTTTQSDNGTQFGYSYLTIRGMGQNRINYTLNGVPLNDGEDLSVYTSNYTDILNSVNSVQIIRGSGVSSNGASSYIGLVNMELDSPFSKRSSDITTMYGSFNSYKASFKHFSGVKNNLGYNFRVSTTGTDGFRYNSSGNSTSLSGSIGYKDEYTTIKLNTVYGITKNGQSWLAVPEGMDPRYNMLSDNSIFGIKPQYDNFKQGIYQLEVLGKVSDYTSVNFSTYLSTINGNYDMPDFSNYGSTNNLELNSHNIGGYLNIRSTNKWFSATTGLNFNNFKREHIGKFEADNTLNYTNNGYKYDISGYNKTTIRFGKINFEGDIQIRNATFKYKNSSLDTEVYNHSFLNYSLGLFTKAGTIRPYANFSKSGRETTRTNLFGYNDNPSSSSELSDVKPEYVTDIELGTKFNGKVRGSFNFYLMNFKNEIVSIGQLNSMGIGLGKNVEKSQRVGIEADIETNLTKGLSLTSNVNISKNSIYDNSITSEPVQTPNFISNIGLNYKLGNLNIGTQYKYVKKSFLDTDNNFILPEYHLLDLNTTYILNKLEISIFVNNLLNKNWTTGGYSDSYGRNFYYTAGINTYLTLKYKL